MNWLAMFAAAMLLIVYPLRTPICILVGLVSMIGGGLFAGIGVGFVTWMIITVVSFILPAAVIGEFIAQQLKSSSNGQDPNRQ